MKLVYEGLKPIEPTIEFEYSDLHDWNDKSIDYTYSVKYDKIIEALADLDKLPEDITDKEIIENIDDYVDKYYDELLEYFRDAAQEDAYENYEEPEPDWDWMPGGYHDRVENGDDY